MSIKKTLADFGITKTKADVYLAALGLGSGTAQQIANKVGIPRTTAHEILQYLTQRGFLSITKKGRKNIYAAEEPTTFSRMLEGKQRRLESSLPELLSLYAEAGSRPHVRVYEGVEGVKTIFEDTLATTDGMLRGILSMKDLYDIPGKQYMDDYVKRRVSSGVKLRVIRSEQKEIEEIWPTSKRDLRTLRYATSGLVFPMTTYIYDNKVSVIGTKKESFGMIIESRDYFETQKNLFEVLWDVSRVVREVY